MRPSRALLAALRVLFRPGLIKTSQGLINALEGIIKTPQSLYKALEGVDKALKDLNEAPRGSLNKAIMGMSKTLEGLIKALRGCTRDLQGLNHARKDLGKALKAVSMQHLVCSGTGSSYGNDSSCGSHGVNHHDEQDANPSAQGCSRRGVVVGSSSSPAEICLDYMALPNGVSWFAPKPPAISCDCRFLAMRVCSLPRL